MEGKKGRDGREERKGYSSNIGNISVKCPAIYLETISDVDAHLDADAADQPVKLVVKVTEKQKIFRIKFYYDLSKHFSNFTLQECKG